jgi:hypothetical protein
MCIKIAIFQVINDESRFLIISVVVLVSYIVSFILLLLSDIFDNNKLSLAFEFIQFLIGSCSLSKDICVLIQNEANFSKVPKPILAIWTIYGLVSFIIYASNYSKQ